jgi:hypothetical protein
MFLVLVTSPAANASALNCPSNYCVLGECPTDGFECVSFQEDCEVCDFFCGTCGVIACVKGVQCGILPDMTICACE